MYELGSMMENKTPAILTLLLAIVLSVLVIFACFLVIITKGIALLAIVAIGLLAYFLYPRVLRKLND